MRVDDQDEEFFVDESSDHRAWAQNLGWLADADRDKALERVDRLAGDRELAAALRLDGFSGQNYDAFANEVARYGWAVIRGWIYKGQIAAEVKRKGFGALDPEPRPGALVEDAESLADETVVLALTAFREQVLLPGKWDPAKGASLRTFFVGQCLLQFSNVYKTWRRQEIRSYVEPWEPEVDRESDELDQGFADPTVPSVEESSVRWDEIRQALSTVSDQRARSAFFLSSYYGYTHDEVGRKLGISGKAVESALARARLQMKKGRETA
ncbi:RNA polymerase sigma factor [Arthrobacter echini]|uniref:RNA polymerase sigma factor n=1 Tax=Arthrobacter echini TaxID=1529066 RepID=UPI0021CCFB02|nr:sigma factor-like helix-turn-helix DNA-binding protein [Arthrobacter echini]